MRKTLLLCYIHGFKGNDQTFSNFPTHLEALLCHSLPKLNITTSVYPSFETRGDLRDCIARFTEWLTNHVIDLEVANGTPSPTVEPSVRTILVGHSMGGIVAADTVLRIWDEKPIVGGEETKEGSLSMFPYIQGVLAFDTPYLGISPGVVAYGAEGQWNMGKAWYETAAGMFAVGGTMESAKPDNSPPMDASKSLPAPPVSPPPSTSPSWERWAKYALAAGAASAALAGVGTAAYMNRDAITSSWTWVGSHLEFVGCLARGEELKRRLAALAALKAHAGVGFTNLYTALGQNAEQTQGDTTWSKQALGDERTFCVLPKSDVKERFIRALNDLAPNEIEAHMYMFGPKENPGYYAMAECAKEQIMSWVDEDWYAGATREGKPEYEMMS